MLTCLIRHHKFGHEGSRGYKGSSGYRTCLPVSSGITSLDMRDLEGIRDLVGIEHVYLSHQASQVWT